jgi:hypothetical protein
MKYSMLFFALLFTAVSVFAQTKQFTREGHIHFFSDGVVEDIEANNYQVTSVIDLLNNKIAFSLQMKGFEFENALMQEHFNEKYVESDKFPKATFEGTFIAETPISTEQDASYPINVVGKMNIHGMENPVSAKGTFISKNGILSGTAEFDITLADYGIKIPGVVKDNIAETVRITVNSPYQAMPEK